MKRCLPEPDKCVNFSVNCCDAEEFKECPTCESCICLECFNDCDFCINFGDSDCIELPNKCSTCDKRICNNCARMCIHGYDIQSCETKVECSDCAKDKYVGLPCKCEYLWTCKDFNQKEEHDYCPRCRQWQNALGKMGMY